MIIERTDIIARLRKDILLMEGYRTHDHQDGRVQLGAIDAAFPGRTFPTGSLHEFISYSAEDSSATIGFIMGIATQILGSAGILIWVSASRSLFPPALGLFGIAPDRIIFIDVKKENDCFWAMEQALHCGSISVVVCESQQLTFTTSRRFQLAIEGSGVTGFVLRKNPGKITPNSCTARWKISSTSSNAEDELPGVGFPRWKVELLKIRNGYPGEWQVEYANREFVHVVLEAFVEPQKHKKVG